MSADDKDDEAPDDRNEEDELALQRLGSASYDLPPSKPLDAAQTTSFLRATVIRLNSFGSASSPAAATGVEESLAEEEQRKRRENLARGPPHTEMWIILLIRMVTRGQPHVNAPSTEVKKEMREDDEAKILAVDAKGNKRVAESTEAEVFERNNILRGVLLDFVLGDFSARCGLPLIDTAFIKNVYFVDNPGVG
jgi:hypothetical protein